MRRLAWLLISTLSVGCGAGAAAVAPKTSETPGNRSAKGSAAGSAPPPQGAGLGALPEGVPEAPKECAQYGQAAPGSCPSIGDLNTKLAAALEQTDVQRDRALSCLEQDASLSPGLVKALRAELAPRGCADLMLSDSQRPAAAARDVADTWVALAVGARLHRSVREPPLPRPPFSKSEFLKHFNEVLKPWVVRQAHAVDQLSKVGPRLNGYARGVLALEAGLADMRFVSLARDLELPEEMKKDPEIRETYLVALEQALEPRVARGRDAALVGLGELARQGIVNDPRLGEARRLLSELYAGRRIDALDGLLLPPLPPLEQSTAALKVAAMLPAFYAVKLSPSLEEADARLLRARLERGVPPGVWLSHKGSTKDPEIQALSLRALFRLGQLYFWSEPFTRAAKLEIDPKHADSVLVQALTQVLAKGPRNAASMMLGPPSLPAALRNTAALDELARQKGALAGLAEFNAAYLRGLSPPENDPAFWKEQTERYQRAQKMLVEKTARAAAGDLAKAANDTEKALRRAPKP